MTAAVKEALAQIPGWEDASWSVLEGGLTNPCWRVEHADGRRAVLKVDAAPRGTPFSPRRLEAEIQGRAAAAGLATAVIYASDTIYLTEYVDGRTWSAGCLDDADNLDKLAVALRELHALPLTGRTFDARAAARDYARRIDAADPEMVARCLQKVEAMPLPHELCCCHNDLVAENIICSPEIRFLDWEYACDNDPFFDLATIVAHHRLRAERADHFLNAYFDGDGSRRRDQLKRQAEFYDALYWLWEQARG